MTTKIKSKRALKVSLDKRAVVDHCRNCDHEFSLVVQSC